MKSWSQQQQLYEWQKLQEWHKNRGQNLNLLYFADTTNEELEEKKIPELEDDTLSMMEPDHIESG